MSLDPESEPVREVYAYYGLAMYWAQCVEQSIFQHLIFFDYFPKAIASYSTSEKWAAEFDQYESRELGQTMGKLVRRLREAGQPTQSIERALADVLLQRNWLAHGYFSDRAIEFTLPEGRSGMIAELESLREVFMAAADELDAITLPLATKYGMTEEMLSKVQAEMMEEYAKSRSNA